MNAKIAERIDQEYREPPFEGLRMTSIPGLAFLRVTTPAPPKAHLNLPGLCLTVRGSKSVSLGDQTFTYGAGEALMVGLPLPVSGLVHVPSERAPYVGLLIELKPALLRQVALESGIPLTPAAGFGPALDVIRIAPAIESCIERMLDLVDAPAEAAFLWPMALRELAFRLLTGPGGGEDSLVRRLGGPWRGDCRSHRRNPGTLPRIDRCRGLGESVPPKHLKFPPAFLGSGQDHAAPVPKTIAADRSATVVGRGARGSRRGGVSGRLREPVAIQS